MEKSSGMEKREGKKKTLSGGVVVAKSRRLETNYIQSKKNNPSAYRGKVEGI